MRFRVFLVIVSLLLVGCRRVNLYTPEVQVRPADPGFGHVFSIRVYGSAMAHYRFMGARSEPGGIWIVKLDPVSMGVITHSGEFSVRPGDRITLSRDPMVIVEFVEIRPARLFLRPVEVVPESPRPD